MDPQEPGSHNINDPRAIIRDGHSLQQLANRPTSDASDLRRQVEVAFQAVRGAMVVRQLADMPVERIKDVTSGGLHIGALRHAGYVSVASIAQAPAGRLQAIHGIGPTTAVQASAAAHQLAESFRDNLAFRLDLDAQDRNSSELISALYRTGWHNTIMRRIGPHVSPLSKYLDTALTDAAPLRSLLRRIFSGRARRETAHRSLIWLARLFEWGDRTGFTAELKTAARVARPGSISSNDAWKDFEKRSPEYYSLLGEIVDLSSNVAGAEGFLPTSIVERVNAQPLDDTFRSVSLRGYQVFGSRFALAQRRTLIGDEMGLGKTIQAIATLAHLRAQGHTHFLVACPANVLINWIREITERSTLSAHRIHGPDRQRNLSAWLDDGGVGVTTVDSLHNVDVSKNIGVAMIVVDEAHYVKNPDTRRSRAVRGWTDHVDRVLFLSGTPMENRIEEFENLVEYLQPQHRLTATKDPQGIAGATAFRKKMAPVYLRRNQDDVLHELPDLTRIDEWVELNGRDSGAYRSAVEEANFMAMRQAAYQSGKHSAKLSRLREILAECAASGRKVVIFSYFRDVLDLVVNSVGSSVFGPLTGSTPTEQRQGLIDKFSATDGHAVLASQVQAGGVGVNMQAANVAVLCEPQLKPTTEEQAIARLHRMGQVRGVRAHRLVAAGSCDERLLEILDQKSKLFDRYARRSDVADSSTDAVDISDAEISRKIVAQEQERLAPAT